MTEVFRVLAGSDAGSHLRLGVTLRLLQELDQRFPLQAERNFVLNQFFHARDPERSFHAAADNNADRATPVSALVGIQESTDLRQCEVTVAASKFDKTPADGTPRQ